MCVTVFFVAASGADKGPVASEEDVLDAVLGDTEVDAAAEADAVVAAAEAEAAAAEAEAKSLETGASQGDSDGDSDSTGESTGDAESKSEPEVDESSVSWEKCLDLWAQHKQLFALHEEEIKPHHTHQQDRYDYHKSHKDHLVFQVQEGLAHCQEVLEDTESFNEGDCPPPLMARISAYREQINALDKEMTELYEVKKKAELASKTHAAQLKILETSLQPCKRRIREHEAAKPVPPKSRTLNATINGTRTVIEYTEEEFGEQHIAMASGPIKHLTQEEHDALHPKIVIHHDEL